MIPAEDSLLRQRLIAKETALKKVTRKFFVFTSALETATSDDCQKLYNDLVGELSQYEFGVRKTQNVHQSHFGEIANFELLHNQKNQELGRVADEIEKLKTELEQERITRRNKEEYASLAKNINTYPSRLETEKEISQLKRDLEVLGEESAALTAKLDLRGKQFQLFLHAVQELQTELQLEQEEEERKRARKEEEDRKRVEEEKEKEREQAEEEPKEAEVVVVETFKDREKEDDGENSDDDRKNRGATRSEREAPEKPPEGKESEDKKEEAPREERPREEKEEGMRAVRKDEDEEGVVEPMQTS